MNNTGKTILAIIFAILSERLFSNPTGGNCVGGEVVIGPSHDHMIIQQITDKAIIDWNGPFHIAPNQTFEIQQPTDNAFILNRVTHESPAIIEGNLKANGNVILIHPSNNIEFTSTSRVDVGGLIATTANIDNDNFLRGKLEFHQTPGRYTSVVNKGHIKIKDSGIAALVAPAVENSESGIITAKHGKIVLGSGTDFVIDVLDFHGDGLIQFAIPQNAMQQRAKNVQGEELKDAVKNSGQLIADAGIVVLKTSDAKQVVENLINMDGIIRADSAVSREGKIILMGGKEGNVKVSGTLTAKGVNLGTVGGKIKILGENIHVMKNPNSSHLPSIDTGGVLGGGEILIGGDMQGKNPAIRNAKNTTIDAGTHIFANAFTKGKGGKIIAFAENYLDCLGTLHAKGGPLGGDGGLVELSGLRGFKLYDQNTMCEVNASAIPGLGKPGSLLIDPDFNVTIANSNTNTTQSGVNPRTWTPNASPAEVAADQVEIALNNGTSVIVVTENAGGTEAGNITLARTIVKTGANDSSLTFIAGGSIFADTLIETTGNLLNITFQSIGPLSITANMITGGGTFSAQSLGFTQQAGSTISTGTGSMTVNALGGAVNFGAGVTSTNNLTISNASTVNLGSLTATGTLAINNSIGNVTGAVTQTGGTTFNVAALTINTGNSVTLANANTITGAVTITNASSNTVQINNTRALTLNASTLSGNLIASSNGAISQAGALSVAGSSTFSSNNNAVTLTNSANNFVGPVAFTNTGTTQLTNATALSLGASTISGNLIAISSGAISQTGAISVTGTSSFLPGANAITLTNSGNNFTGAATFINSGSNDISVSGTLLTIASSTAGGNLSLSASTGMRLVGATTLTAQNMTFSGLLDGGFDLTLNAATTGNITINNNIGSQARLGAFSVPSVRNFTNNATLNATTFSSIATLAPNLTNLGPSTLNTTGNASIIADAVVGNVAIGGTLTLGVNSGVLTGSVGTLPILFVSGREPTTAGAITFNGNDLFSAPAATTAATADTALAAAQAILPSVFTSATSGSVTDSSQMRTGSQTTSGGEANGGGKVTRKDEKEEKEGEKSKEKSTEESESKSKSESKEAKEESKSESKKESEKASTEKSKTEAKETEKEAKVTEELAAQKTTSAETPATTQTTEAQTQTQPATAAPTATTESATQPAPAATTTPAPQTTESKQTTPVPPVENTANTPQPIIQEGFMPRNIEGMENLEGQLQSINPTRTNMEGKENIEISSPETKPFVGNRVEGVERSPSNQTPLSNEEINSYISTNEKLQKGVKETPQIKPEESVGIDQRLNSSEMPKTRDVEGFERLGNFEALPEKSNAIESESIHPRGRGMDMETGSRKGPLTPAESEPIDNAIIKGY